MSRVNKNMKTVEKNAVVATEMPEYLKGASSRRGSENVTTDDLIIPRVELVQDLSPCRKRNDPSYIEGCDGGMLYNNVTRELYGTDILIIPVFYRKEYLVWKDRADGGGFRGAFSTMAEAETEIAIIEDGDKCEAVETAQHFCLLIDPVTGKEEEVVLSLSRSKMKASRTLNSLIRMSESDSFSRVYKVSAVAAKNAKNQDFFNVVVSPAGFPSERSYKRAEALYESIMSGSVKVDRNFESSSDQDSEY